MAGYFGNLGVFVGTGPNPKMYIQTMKSDKTRGEFPPFKCTAGRWFCGMILLHLKNITPVAVFIVDDFD